jgi:hypothetical protein
MIGADVVQTRLDTLASDLKLTAKQRADGDAILAGDLRPPTVRRHPKVRRYVDEAIVQRRETDKANGVTVMPAQNEILQRTAERARAMLWQHVTFPDGEYRLSVGEITLPSGAVFNLKTAIAAGLGHCIKGLSFDRNGVPVLELADSAAADRDLAEYLGLKKLPPLVEDDDVRAGREALAKLLGEDPKAARELEAISVRIDILRVKSKG